MKTTAGKKHRHLLLRIPAMLMLGIAALSGISAYGQGTASVVGTITDPSGAVVANAKITITNSDNGFVRATLSNTTGSYKAPELPNGRYLVKVEAQGFKTYEQKNLTLNVGDTVRVDVSLQIGAVGQSVTVEANAIQVQVDTNEVSQTITSNQISQLATNGRNILQLTTLVPGAASTMPDFDSPVAQFQNRSVAFNGMRSDGNNWIIDGGEAYDRGGGGILLVSPSQDAIQEFKVMTSNFAADLGNSSGGMISMAIKNGTKQFHGGAWEYNRNDALDAYSYLSKQSSKITKSELRYNTFGFNIGGPVEFRSSRPKTFFFYNMEWRREINGGNIFTQVPTATEWGGDLSTITKTIKVPTTTDASAIAKYASYGLAPGQQFSYNGKANVIPPALISSNAKAYLAGGIIKMPNASGGYYYSSANTTTFYREEAVRVDHQFNDKFTVFGHLLYDSGTQNIPTATWTSTTFPTIGSLETVPSWSGVVHATMNFRPNLLNEAAFSTNGNNITIAPTGLWKAPSGWSTTPLYASANTLSKVPSIYITVPYTITADAGNWPWSNTWRSYQYKDDLSWTHGAHNFKFGGAYMHTHKNQETFANVAGQYWFNGSATGSGLADFLLGNASQFSQVQLQDSVSISFNTVDGYVMDDWRLGKRLTLNLGLRWEGVPHAFDTNNRMSNFYPDMYNSSLTAQFLSAPGGNAALNSSGPGFTTVPNVALSTVKFYMNGIGLAGRGVVPRGMVKNHWNTFAPRVGFAYDMFNNQKTILRGGSGIFYERNAGNEEYNMGTDPPFTNSATTYNPYVINPAISWTDGASAGSSPTFPSGFTGIQYKYPITTVFHFSFGIQQQLRSNAVATVSYVGNTSAHLSQTVDVNTLLPNDTTSRLEVCGSNCGYTGTLANLNPNYARQYKGFGGINLLENEGNSHYHSLQASLRITSWKNLTFDAAYTYSHAWDIVDGQIWNNISNPFNPSYDKGTAGFDRRHILVTNFDYAIPFFHNAQGVTKTLLGGWALSGMAMFQSGTPLNITTPNDILGFGGNTTNRANLVSPVNYPHTFNKWFDANAFAVPTALTWGNSPKNAVKGPGRDNWNISLFKDFRFGERASFMFRAESFNTWNHTQFTGVNTSLSSSTVGKITGIADPRVFQLGAKISF